MTVTGNRGTRFTVGKDTPGGKVGLLVMGQGEAFTTMDWLTPADARDLAVDLKRKAAEAETAEPPR